MKILPFLIFICLTFLLYHSSILPASAKSASQVTVSAYIDEHLTYVEKDGQITISTNSQQGLILLNREGNKQFFGPSEKTFPLNQPFFILVVNF